MTAPSARRPMSMRRRVALIVVALACISVLADFLGFVGRSERYGPPQVGGADAVVVLTGAKGRRIVAAAAYAEAERLPLLVSGVHPSLDTQDIVELSGVQQAYFDCCVTVGQRAASTAENGLETANWARAAGYKRIVLVTSGYHVDRAMIELGRFMPEAEFVAYSVDTGDLTPSNWWRSPGEARRTFMQWLKYRGAYVRALVARPKAPD
ncbi:MAG: YdcF family protein [Pseudomonadota bacterium]